MYGCRFYFLCPTLECKKRSRHLVLSSTESSYPECRLFLYLAELYIMPGSLQQVHIVPHIYYQCLCEHTSFGWGSKETSLFSCRRGCSQGWVILPGTHLSFSHFLTPKQNSSCLRTEGKLYLILVLINWKAARGLFYPENKQKVNFVLWYLLWWLSARHKTNQYQRVNSGVDRLGYLHLLPTLPSSIKAESLVSSCPPALLCHQTPGRQQLRL